MLQSTGVLARWAVVAGVAALAVAGAAGTAVADGVGGEEVRLSPYRSGPGADLRITAYDCQGPAYARSDAFQNEPELEEDDSGVAVGWAQVDYGAQSGPHTVEVDCRGDGGTLYGEFYVVDGYAHRAVGGLALARGAARAAEGWQTVPRHREPGFTPGWETGVAAVLVGAGALALLRRRGPAGRG
ncbi:hypothetical protein [Streptosporangium sp. NPDC000239]|uniref:MYXO-CTERM domain-containing protein n=1 Tax=Streptosporangium jomthongense TaxID=1193683 RepID=A0ABV8FC10_9ACTN